MATKEPLDSASAETTVYYITNMIPTEELIEASQVGGRSSHL